MGFFGVLNVLDNESSSKFTTNRHQSNSRKPRLHMTARLAAHISNPSHKKKLPLMVEKVTVREGAERTSCCVGHVTWDLVGNPRTAPHQTDHFRLGFRRRSKTAQQVSGFQHYRWIKGIKRERGELRTERRICCIFTKLKIHNLSLSTRTLWRGLSYISNREMPYSHRRMQKIFGVG